MIVCEEEKTKLYQDKEWLQKKYIDESLSSNQIGEVCNVCPGTILNHLKRDNIL